MRITVAIILWLIFGYASASLEHSRKRAIELGQVYYDCGHGTIEERIAQAVVASHLGMNSGSVHPFVGLLYPEDLHYRVLSIPKRLSPAPAQIGSIVWHNPISIVIDPANQIVDLVTEIKNGHHVQCKRVDGSIPEPPIDPRVDFAYKCGHEYYTSKTLHWSISEAMSESSRGARYPALYIGHLYRPELQYSIYPILRGRKVPQKQRTPEYTYYVVFSPKGELVDVVAGLYTQNFIQCTKVAAITDDEPESDIRVGYLCDLEFLDQDTLRKSALLAKQRSSTLSHTYPRLYDGPPFDKGEHWVYPFISNDVIYVKGLRHPKYFLLMDTSFQVVGAISKTKNGFKLCPETLSGIEMSIPETGDFSCKTAHFSNRHLMETLKIACKSRGAWDRNFPANYIGPPFNIAGPYLTWPLMRRSMFKSAPSKFRLVFNTDCQLAGVIARKDHQLKTFYKCARSVDGVIPGGDSDLPITERIQYTRTRQKKLKRPIAMPKI